MLKFLEKWLPIDVSLHGQALDEMTAWVHWLMAILFVGWGLYFVYVLFRFRAKKNPTASYRGAESHLSTYSEIAVAVVEAVLLLGFAIPAWARWVEPPAPETDPLTVRVVGEQFAWNVHYPGPDGFFSATDPHLVSVANPLGLDPDDPVGQDDVVAVNQLRIPVDRPITVLLGSKDVIHSFSLPYLRVKQDAIPGMEIPVYFQATESTPESARFPKCAAGKECWEISCAQLCGLGHFRMRGFLTVLEQDEFDSWMNEQLAAKMPEPEPEPAVEEGAEEATAEGEESTATASAP